MPHRKWSNYLAEAEQLERLIDSKKNLTAVITRKGLTEERLQQYNSLEEEIERVEVAVRIHERNILLYDCQAVS
ncbi:hypothetical protein GCM10007425_27630 [Lysinibacillus alkalisoli]|uniref:Uncharacterized protein n=1 Tax=Lysinibacillus alkalisoli TaxID=1911548 RepID=A0A917GA63_9BACI|nr:hypothetical protein [Lysinibacillus alkalisoli]GGG31487.1 hypothetical protein GCM10007425_27630 [Lysinibacillus alkalisoli]